jgi:hypothetical protein
MIHTRELLEETGTTAGFGISVNEGAPIEALEKSPAVIFRVLRKHGTDR